MTPTKARGRPLRFLGTVMAGWIGLRIFILWPQLESPGDVLRAIAPVSVAVAEPTPLTVPPTGPLTLSRRAGPAAISSHDGVATPRRPPGPAAFPSAQHALARYGDDQPIREGAILPGVPRTVAAAAPAAGSPASPSRWSGSVWLVARGGSGIAPGALGGQLGGSQAGARLAYLLDRKHRLALAARVAAPLGPGLREAALGVEWQPTRLPVRLVVEERFALGGGSSGPAIGVVGGFGPLALPSDLALEGYGQAGAIRRRDTQIYADGAVRLGRTLASVGRARIDLAAAAWGAAQRGAARLDLGPSLGLSVPLGKQPVRLTLDWRQRVAGDARPGSGPALTLGTDF